MRISDWSSDVCPSDLCYEAVSRPCPPHPRERRRAARPHGRGHARGVRLSDALFHGRRLSARHHQEAAPALNHPRAARSEEHTSELQSLMRISYAVFCLKKKTKHYISSIHQTQI